MGISFEGPSWLFGNIASVMTSSSMSQSTLNKWHNALSYHCVRECIALSINRFINIPGKHNLSDIIAKPFRWVNLWALNHTLRFCED
jgi:hypothetical protein